MESQVDQVKERLLQVVQNKIEEAEREGVPVEDAVDWLNEQFFRMSVDLEFMNGQFEVNIDRERQTIVINFKPDDLKADEFDVPPV